MRAARLAHALGTLAALAGCLGAVACTPPVVVARVPDASTTDAPDDFVTPDVPAMTDAPPGHDVASPDTAMTDAPVVDTVDAPSHDVHTGGCPPSVPLDMSACTLDAGTHCDYPSPDPCMVGVSCACPVTGHWTCAHTPPPMSCDAAVHD